MAIDAEPGCNVIATARQRAGKNFGNGASGGNARTSVAADNFLTVRPIPGANPAAGPANPLPDDWTLRHRVVKVLLADELAAA